MLEESASRLSASILRATESAKRWSSEAGGAFSGMTLISASVVGGTKMGTCRHARESQAIADRPQGSGSPQRTSPNAADPEGRGEDLLCQGEASSEPFGGYRPQWLGTSPAKSS